MGALRISVFIFHFAVVVNIVIKLARVVLSEFLYADDLVILSVTIKMLVNTLKMERDF